MLPLLPARWTWGLVFGFTWSLQPQAYSASNVSLNKNSTTSSAKPEKVKFDTVDQVQLQGTFYPSPQDRKGTTVLFLHKIGSHSQKDNWDKLAETLQAAGCAVLSFDFRGHGESLSVAPEFWQQPANQNIRGFNLAKPKATISYKDFPPAYMPYLVNDIAAAKSFLDRKNNGGDCNSSNLILIGAEDGATLGAMWLYADLHRHRVTSLPFAAITLDNTPEGKDVMCAIWLSISPTLGNRQVPLRRWLQTAGRDKKIPMAFLYGAQDDRGRTVAETLFRSIKSNHRDNKKGKDGDNKQLSGTKPILKTKLIGSALFHKTLKTQEWITKEYIPLIMSKKGAREWAKRDIDKERYIWNFPGGVLMNAKQEGEKYMLPIPLNVMGINP